MHHVQNLRDREIRSWVPPPLDLADRVCGAGVHVQDLPHAVSALHAWLYYMVDRASCTALAAPVVTAAAARSAAAHSCSQPQLHAGLQPAAVRAWHGYANALTA